MGNVYGKFAEQNDIVLTGQILTSNNNTTALNVALDEANHLRATPASFQPDGLTIVPGNNVPSVTTALTSTISAAQANIGQEGTPSQEPGGGGNPCPTLHQFVMIRSDKNTPIPTLVKYVEVGMYLWSPRSGAFEKVVHAQNVTNQDIWGVGAVNQLKAEGSASHTLILDEKDETGTWLSKCESLTPCMGWVAGEARPLTYHVRNLDRKATVRQLETEGPTHIYVSGTSPMLMLWWHNLKPEPPFGG